MSGLTLSENLIHSTVRIECYNSSGQKSSGTGFFYGFLDDGKYNAPAIVTNRHVFEGAEIASFHFTLNNGKGGPIYGRYERVTIRDFSKSWMPHPDPDVDLAVLPIGFILDVLSGRNIVPFFNSFGNSFLLEQDQLAELTAIEEVTMVGYPNGIWDSVNNLPIVRRGITATPLHIDYQGKTEFVIDAACFPGSSGSPIVLLNQGSFAKKDGSVGVGTRFALLGVLYAGPYHTATGEIKIANIPTADRPVPISRIPNNLGYCIKGSRIVEFDAPLRARVGNPPSASIKSETV